MRHLLINLGPAQIPCHILAIDSDGILAPIGNCRRLDVDIEVARQLRRRWLIAGIDAMPERSSGQRAIHHAGIEVEVAQPLRQQLAQRAFAGTCRAIDCNCVGCGHHSYFSTME